MTGHSHELPPQNVLQHRLNEVKRELARAEKEQPERVHALTEEVRKLEKQLED